VPVGTDAEPREIDQANRDGAHSQRVERVERHVLSHREAQVGQLLGKPDQLLELRLVLLSAECRVVAVLPASGSVDPRRLEPGARARRDPNVFPRRRDGETL
jgi:hypothetical protein